MIKNFPFKNAASQIIAMGVNIHLQSPARGHKVIYRDFIRSNKSFHEPWVYIPDDGRYYDQYLKRLKTGKTLGFFIFTNDNNEFVGVINLNNIQLSPFSSASLGYYMDQNQCRNGYMAEAIKLVLSHAFYKIGLNRIEANIQPDNLASRALVKYLGFNCEGFSPRYLQIGGQYRDHERWAYLSDQL